MKNRAKELILSLFKPKNKDAFSNASGDVINQYRLKDQVTNGVLPNGKPNVLFLKGDIVSGKTRETNLFNRKTFGIDVKPTVAGAYTEEEGGLSFLPLEYLDLIKPTTMQNASGTVAPKPNLIQMQTELREVNAANERLIISQMQQETQATISATATQLAMQNQELAKIEQEMAKLEIDDAVANETQKILNERERIRLREERIRVNKLKAISQKIKDAEDAYKAEQDRKNAVAMGVVPRLALNSDVQSISQTQNKVQNFVPIQPNNNAIDTVHDDSIYDDQKPNTQTEKPNNTLKIVGIVVGSLILLGGIAFGIYFFIYKKD